MKFRIEDKIFADFDNPIIGVIVCKGIDNKGDNPEIGRLLREVENELRKKLNGADLATHPHIAPWRQAYQKFGAKPRDFRSSIEALSRIVLKGVQIRNISKLVDLYNLISIKHLLPVGAEDLDKMQGDLVLGFAKGDENYIPLGGAENDPPLPGEVVYKDDLGVICRRWNWREGDRTKITNQTTNAIVVIESLAPISREVAEKAMNEFANLVQKYCGGSIATFLLDESNREIIVDF